MSNTPPDLIGSKAASGICDVDRSTFTRWVADGKVQPAVRLGGDTGPMLFFRSDVEEFARARAALRASAA